MDRCGWRSYGERSYSVAKRQQGVRRELGRQALGCDTEAAGDWFAARVYVWDDSRGPSVSGTVMVKHVSYAPDTRRLGYGGRRWQATAVVVGSALLEADKGT